MATFRHVYSLTYHSFLSVNQLKLAKKNSTYKMTKWDKIF